MLKNIITNNITRYLIIFLSVVCIISIRGFQSALFYDPYIIFFENNFQNLEKPLYNSLEFYLNISLRYFVNAILSIVIIAFLFNKAALIKFLLLLYGLLFLIFISLLYFFLEVYFIDWQIVFYVRRFLIQPLLLILFIPGFYFQEIVSKKTLNL